MRLIAVTQIIAKVGWTPFYASAALALLLTVALLYRFRTDLAAQIVEPAIGRDTGRLAPAAERRR